MVISLPARCDIIPLSLFLGRDIIGDIITCWVGYHSTFIIFWQGYHWYLLGGISFCFHYFSAGISLVIPLPARWDIILLSLFLGRDIIGDIITCQVGYHSTSPIVVKIMYQYMAVAQLTLYIHSGSCPPAKKYRDMPGCQSWLGLVIETFDGQVGWFICWGCRMGGRGNGAVGQGLGAPVNRHQQCPMWSSGAALAVGHVGGHFGAGNFVFGKEPYIVNPSGMFLHLSGTRGGRKSKRQCVSEVRPSQLGKECQWACSTQFCCWARWAWFSMAKKMYNIMGMVLCT